MTPCNVAHQEHELSQKPGHTLCDKKCPEQVTQGDRKWVIGCQGQGQQGMGSDGRQPRISMWDEGEDLE